MPDLEYPAAFTYTPSVSSTADLSYSTSHVEEGKAMLLEQFKDKPRLAALLGVFLGQVQAAESALWQLFSERTVDTAIGVQLDSLGTIVGETRQGLSDADYRTLIRGRIAANKSMGREGDLRDVAFACLGSDSSSVISRTFAPAEVEVTVGDPITAFSPYTVARLLKIARAACVRLVLRWTQQVESSTFGVSDLYSVSEINQASEGFGWSGDASLGGALTGAID